MSLDKDNFCQIGLIVRDRDRTVRLLSRLFDVEPFGLHDSAPLEEAQTELRGQPEEGRVRMAFLDLGKIQLEIMEPFGGKSTWQEYLDEHGEGIHHIAFRVEDRDAKAKDLEAAGFELIQKGDFGSGRYAYFENEGRQGLGIMFELLEFYG